MLMTRSMMNRKPPDVRRGQIMDAAERLFVSKGFEDTSVNDILQAVGIAKGTFYHHFVSKEAVMDAIIDRYTGLIRERSDKVLSQEHLPVHQKLFGVVLAGRVQDGSQSELLGELHRPENAAFHVRSQQRALAAMIPIMADITREGIREGLFSTRFPEEAVEMILLYAYSVFDELSVSEPEDAARKAQAFVHHVELLLGAAPDSFAYLTQVLPT
jgi:AcrR family transcriptional regulator